MRDMMSVILEGALDEELDEELGYSKYDYRNKETDNSRNGHSSKTMHTSYGDMDVAIPRDRNGDYEPQLIKKYQNSVTQDMEEKILSMYAKGMTTGDIESHMRELYDIDISDSTISRITDKILPIVKEWQERPLEEVYAVVFMDAIHYHVRSEGRIVKRAVYIALGIDMNGKKDVLGMYVGENESAKFWLSIMNGLKNRGVEDILIACVDGLNGFPQAIEAVYPKTEIQQCIIHQIRNSKAATRMYLNHRRQKAQKTHGKTSVKKLVGEGVGVSSIEVTDGNIKSFERVARKYNVDFAVKKDKTTDPPKYVVFFKGRDADAVAQAFKEFVYGNEKRKGRTSVREKLKRFRDAVSQNKNRERSREKNKDRGQSL